VQIKLISAVVAASMLAVVSSPADAQIYVLTNDLGESIIVPPGEKDPEAFILAKMVGRKGASWRMDHVETRKGCLARRSISSYGKPTRWVRAFAATREEAERAAVYEARAATGVPTSTPGAWEQGYCNRETAAAREIDVPTLEEKFRRGAK